MINKGRLKKIFNYYSADEKAQLKNEQVFVKYRNHTMIPKKIYIANVVECGVWKGGMSAGIAEILGNSKKYFLFDSFEGLPAAKEIDGLGALEWQKNTSGEHFYNNCTASEHDAETAMKKTGCSFKLIKGWFNETLPGFDAIQQISVLRLDGDWYDSTMQCLMTLYPKLVYKGLLIIDDYYAWDGCSRAVHEYLFSINSVSRINSYNKVAFIIKEDAR